MKGLKVGDCVQYTPVILKDRDTPTEGVITKVEPAGSLFLMDMVVIDTVEHWIPAHECRLVEDTEVVE